MISPSSPRTTRSRRTSLITTLVATAIGFTASVMDASVAVAAPGDPVTPTITVPATFEGYGRITITGTARPGATVDLYEAAYLWRTDLAKAAEVYSPQDVITDVAGSDGTYHLSRIVDSGFVFAVEADGLMSEVKTVTVKVVADLQVTTTTGTSTVHATVSASPGQPSLDVRVQRKSASTWATVAEGSTADSGTFSATLSNQPAGSQTYRAWVGGDPSNALVESEWVQAAPVTVGGTITTPATPTKPTTPAPTSNAAGSVQFTKIQYNAPGKDTGSNASRNGEWVRLTNKTKKTINLKNWTVRDVAGHVYKFTSAYSLGAGKHMYVLTGKGTNGKPASTYRYWGSSAYVWNNAGDTAYLSDGTNKAIDSCRWTKDKSFTYC